MGTQKTCTVSFQDSGGVRHAVEVGAETLYEAAVRALKVFREHDCSSGPAAHLMIEVKNPSVTHTVVARKVEKWLTGGARSPSECAGCGFVSFCARICSTVILPVIPESFSGATR